MSDSQGFTAVYCVGVLSCWYHGAGFGVGLFWPWFLGSVFVNAWGYP